MTSPGPPAQPLHSLYPALLPPTPSSGLAATLGCLMTAVVLVGTGWLFAVFGKPLVAGIVAICAAALLIVLGTGALWASWARARGWARHRLAVAEALAICESVLEGMEEGVLLADARQPGTPLIHVNSAFSRITGYSAEEATGKNCRYLQGADRLQPEIAQIRAAMESRTATRVTLRNYRKDGTRFWNDLHLVPVAGADRLHFVGIMRDVTDLKDMQSQLDHISYIDSLTLVPNRHYFYEKLTSFLGSGAAACGFLAKVDIAHFHEINTSYGYEAGDSLLGQVAERLSRLANGFVGRLSADEFALVIPLANATEAERPIGDLQAILREEFILPGAKISVRFAIGFTIGEAGDDATALLRQAGAALQISRRSRLREAHGFDRQIDAGIRNRVLLTRELQRALRSEEFFLDFQPKVNLRSGEVVGAEALVRWRHPVFGLQPPSRFIPLAEETGLILDIGAWVLGEAARFAVRINRGRAKPLAISVNVSQMQFTQRNMPECVRHALDQSDADPSWLILELTESLFADGSPEMVGSFRDLREMGVGLSIDDFGTGYSSLRYIEQFPISEVKVDRSFVHELGRKPVKRIIVDAVVKLGAELQIAVVAEGVETEDERAALRELGCIYGQGYLFGRPMSESELMRFAVPGQPACNDGPDGP